MWRKSLFSKLEKFLLSSIFASLLFFLTFKTASAQVVINEFVPDAGPEWVEFHNASDSADYLKDYWLDDDTDFESDTGSTAKKHLTNLNISCVEYPYIELTSMLNNSGDFVVLFDGSGNIVDQYQYTSGPGDGIAIGRSPNITGNFSILTSSTKGGPNSNPVTPTPVQTVAPTTPPTVAPTVAPTTTPVPTKTPSPTPKPTLKATIKPMATQSPTGNPLVLGKATSAPSKSPEVLVDAESESKVPVIAYGLIGLGGLSIGGAFYPFLKAKIKGYNNGDGQVT